MCLNVDFKIFIYSWCTSYRYVDINNAASNVNYVDQLNWKDDAQQIPLLTEFPVSTVSCYPKFFFLIRVWMNFLWHLAELDSFVTLKSWLRYLEHYNIYISQTNMSYKCYQFKWWEANGNRFDLSFGCFFKYSIGSQTNYVNFRKNTRFSVMKVCY